MCDTLDETLHAASDGDPRDNISRPTTLDPSRALRRTASCASIDTVRPSGNKGIRRRIEEIAENLKRKSTKKKSALSIPKNTPRNAEHSPEIPPGSKTARCGRTTTPPLQSLPRSEEKSVLHTSDSDRGIVHQDPELDAGPTLAVCDPDPPVDVPLFKDEKGVYADYALPVRILQPSAHFTTGSDDDFQSPQTPKITVKDLKLDIRSSQTNITIWDGLRAPHHVFKCRLFLCCIAHPYDSVPLPDIRFVEMDCNTCPAGSHYARPPVLQAAYQGAAPGSVKNHNDPPNVSLAAGIHMDRAWYKIQNNDGTWGWYRDVFVPLSPRLFDKVDYREFKLTSRLWMGESCIEDELTFGISMLLREVDMK